MLSRAGRWTLGLVLGQTLLLWGTLHVPGLGEPMWHHFASLILVLVFVIALWRRIAGSRRMLAMGVLAFSVLATISGFWLLYWKEGIRVDGYQDWGVFWHVIWSWGWMVFFLLHTWINRVAYFHFIRRSVNRIPPAIVHLGLYAVGVAAFAWTWGPARSWFTNDIYIPLSLYTWIALAVPPYLVWLLVQARTRTAGRPLQEFSHWPVRRFVDLSLVPVSVLIVLSGVVLAFMDPVTDAYGWKYVAKYWHVWPSVAFVVLAFVHGHQAWTTVKAHWRRFEPQSSPDTAREVPVPGEDTA